MSYRAWMDLSQVRIPRTNTQAALDAVRALMAEYTGHLEWVGRSSVMAALERGSLIDTLRAWRYLCEAHEGFFSVTEWTGEKLGDDELLWRALSPLCAEGGVIDGLGADGAKWLWRVGGPFQDLLAPDVYLDNRYFRIDPCPQEPQEMSVRFPDRGTLVMRNQDDGISLVLYNVDRSIVVLREFIPQEDLEPMDSSSETLAPLDED